MAAVSDERHRSAQLFLVEVPAHHSAPRRDKQARVCSLHFVEKTIKIFVNIRSGL